MEFAAELLDRDGSSSSASLEYTMSGVAIAQSACKYAMQGDQTCATASLRIP